MAAECHRLPVRGRKTKSVGKTTNPCGVGKLMCDGFSYFSFLFVVHIGSRFLSLGSVNLFWPICGKGGAYKGSCCQPVLIIGALVSQASLESGLIQSCVAARVVL